MPVPIVVRRTARQQLVGVTAGQDAAFQRTQQECAAVEAHYLLLLDGHVREGWLSQSSSDLEHRLERWTVCTRHNPDVADEWNLARIAPRFPSYLRRAIIRRVIGQAKSWWTRYQRWLARRDQHRRRQAARTARGRTAVAFKEHPPLFPRPSGKQSTFYFDQTCQVQGHGDEGFDLTAGYFRTADLKVLDEHGQWVWTTAHLRVPTRLYKLTAGWVIDPPTLVNKGGVWRLHIPYHRKVEVYRFAEWHASGVPVLGGRLERTRARSGGAGGNQKDRTAGRSRFIRAAELGTPRLHVILQHIRAAYRSQGQQDLPGHFCSAQWRHLRRVADYQAHKLAVDIVSTARHWGLYVIALENLSSLAPAKWRRGMRNQRIMYWLHRRTARYVKAAATAAGILVGVVNPAGTSLSCPRRASLPGMHWIVRGNYGRNVCCSCGWFHDADRAGAWNVGIAWWDGQDERTDAATSSAQAGCVNAF
ncbi:MAG: zinc ribbon domain-containing protein [Chloroflexota bacterium]